MNQEIVIQLVNGIYIKLWFSDNEVGEDSENCDSVIGYNIYSRNRDLLDGGEMDYNSDEKNYDSIEDAIDDIIEFVESEVNSSLYRILDLDAVDDFE